MFVGLFLFMSCGKDDSPETKEPPVAVNDSGTTSENRAVTLFILQNDDLKNGATVTSFDDTSANNGTIVQGQNSDYIYTPSTNFVGTDTFSYTICDDEKEPNCSTAIVTITVTDEGNPVAVSDSFEVVENTTVILTDLLVNDTVVDGAEINAITTTSTKGTVVLNNDGTISYTASNGFSGEDLFTYTLCDNDKTPTCDSATVTITVTDENNPTANNDAINLLENATATIVNVLENDAVLDDAVLTAIDNTDTQGTVVLNANGTISYTPKTGFTGEDIFKYALCDDDTPGATCSSATVTVTVVSPIVFKIPSELVNYYSETIFTAISDIILEELKTLTKSKHTTILSYTQRHDYLYHADADLNNSENVVLMYSGESRYWKEYTSGSNSHTEQTYNTEHVYPKSLFVASSAETDLHHLRSCDASINSRRSNNPFVDGSGTYNLANSAWFPGDEWKGDVARMIMYLNIRYSESFSRVGGLELFLKWNVEDPVSAFEIQRNTVIKGAQGNRNPFIDNPYLATLIWGGDAAENTWD